MTSSKKSSSFLNFAKLSFLTTHFVSSETVVFPYLIYKAFFSRLGVINSSKKRLRKRKKTIGFKILITIENRDMPKTLAAVNSPESESSPKVKTDDTTQHRANISQNLPTIIKAK